MTRKSPAMTSGLGTVKTTRLGAAVFFLSMASCAIFIGIAIQSNSLFIPLAGAVLAGLGVFISVIFRRKLATGMNLVENNLARLAEGDTNLEFPDEESEADFANMICSITTISDSTEENMRLQMDYSGQVAAIGKAQAVVEFNMDGTIISANDLFLNVMGYRLDEIKGQHHRVFVDPDFRESTEYRAFWDKLNRGEYDARIYKRIGKDGKEIWLRASYNPILDLNGKPFKVVKYASNITEDRIRNADFEGQIEAIGKAQPVIEFNMDGTIITANDLFLNALGYHLAEIQGQHHSIFVAPGFKESAEYRAFWDKLNRGEYESREYRRVGKGGREVWIQASYNPIMDLNGKPFKVVKYATDVTRQKQQNIINQHIKTATDGVKTNIMMVDTDYRVVYMNKTMQDMIKLREVDLRTDLRTLDFSNPVGATIDAFHKDPTCLRKILDNSGTVSESHIEVGGMEFDLVVSQIHDGDGKPAGTVLEWEDVTVTMAREQEQQRIATENQRIRIALDNASTNMMVADKDFNIVYMNDALLKMMRDAEADLRKVLPNFDANRIIGSNIDIFHQNPAHQRAMLQNITTTISANIKVGIFDFNLIVNPVADEAGERLGTVVEWRDMSQELAIEAEIDKVVQATLAGDFTQRVTTEGKQGFMLGLAKNINDIGSTTQTATDDMAWIMAQLAKGDLTEKIETEYQGTFDLLKNSSNETVDQLIDIVTKVNQSAGEVASASAELSTGSDDLSRRTEAQASALEETAASMEQLAVTVKQNADNAKDANKLAGESREMAVNGGTVAKEAVEAMGVIEDSSQKVSDIIGVIDDLAFQTNLLALNAAVEAARAGEAGKGFAVVAEEVRTLAQRSAQASNEIKSLITSSNAQVKCGVELVNNAGTVLGDIMESISRVATIVSEIASASSEQTQGIDEVNVAIAEMDDMTQQNSSLVEQSTAAARVLERQAAEMQRLMSFFDVGAASEQQATLSPVLLRQHQVERSVTPEAVVKPKLNRKLAGNGAGSPDSGWAEF